MLPLQYVLNKECYLTKLEQFLLCSNSPEDIAMLLLLLGLLSCSSLLLRSFVFCCLFSSGPFVAVPIFFSYDDLFPVLVRVYVLFGAIELAPNLRVNCILRRVAFFLPVYLEQ